MPFRSPGLILKTQEMEKGSQEKPKSYHMKIGLNGKTAYKTTSRQGKQVVVCPLSYVIRKDTSIPEDSENRDVQIIYQPSLVGNMFTRDSRKVLDILN